MSAQNVSGPPDRSGKGNKSSSPLRKGFDVQYERLLEEEVCLKKTREDFLGGEAGSSSPATDKLQTLKTLELVHIASLEGLLITAQYAAGDVCSVTADGFECKRGLESTEQQNALVALWTTKSRELEKENNETPLGIGSESLIWRQRLSSGTRVGNGSTSRSKKCPAVFEANVEGFWDEFQECRRKVSASDDYGKKNSTDSGDETTQNFIPKANKKQVVRNAGPKHQPVVVTCPSGTPSESSEGKTISEIVGKEEDMQNHLVNKTHIQHNQKPLRLTENSDPSRNRGYQQHPSRHQNEPNNPYNSHNQHSQRYQNPSFLGQHNYNGRQWQSQRQRGPKHNQSQIDYQHGAFEYSDIDPSRNDDQSSAKKNPFCTAKELGPNFNDQQYESNILAECSGDGWDSFGGNGVQHHGNNRRSDSRINGRSKSSAPSDPQKAIRATIRGPKDSLSAGLKRKFQPPMKREIIGGNGQTSGKINKNCDNINSTSNRHAGSTSNVDGENLPEELKGLEKELIEKINNEIVDSGEPVTFDDIAGLEHAKDTVNEMVIMPMKRPDLFTGLRSCAKGLLLFGPPGTGKTLIGKAIAHESGATFFSISSSSLTSKWIGEGEKMVKTLFAVASYRAPSVVFIDEVDSMLTQRKADENEASRRIKTEFLVQLEGTGNKREGQVLVIGATNLPHELDEAARRRFVKKLYIPLPDQSDREALIHSLLKKSDNTLSNKEIAKLSHDTNGFSGADLKKLCADAAFGPMRELGSKAMTIHINEVPPISFKHFKKSLRSMSPSVAQSELTAYIEFNDTYGDKISYSCEDSYGSDAGSDSKSL